MQTEISDLAIEAERQVKLTVEVGEIERGELHKQTVRHLIQNHGCTLQNARMHAARAIADHLSKDTKARVDTAKTTGTCVFVEIDGDLRACPVVDIARLFDNDPQN